MPANAVSSQWTELPLVTPHQMRAARLIKYAFTGDLAKNVVSSPPFHGQEKHLLKAQLVRITHNCEIVPKGLYAPLEDNPDEVDLAEDFKMPDFTEQANLENWVHLNPYILKQGRATYFVDAKLPEEQREEWLAKLGESDPRVERLKAINEDKGSCAATQVWRSSGWRGAGAPGRTGAVRCSTTWGRRKARPAATA